MSRPHENDENDANDLQSGKIWKRNTVSVSCGRVEFTENANFWKRIRVNGAWNFSVSKEKIKISDGLGAKARPISEPSSTFWPRALSAEATSHDAISIFNDFLSAWRISKRVPRNSEYLKDSRDDTKPVVFEK